MSSYELIFKIINITSGTNLKVCSLSISTSAIESCSVDLTYIINIYSISILNCQRCICTVGRCFRSFRCCCGICCFCYLRSFCNLLSLSSFLRRSRCCSRCNIFMIVCYFKSLENFLFFFDVCIIQPLLCSVCIQCLLSCRNDAFFLGLCRFFIILLVQFYNIICCICFDDIGGNLSIIECPKNIDHFLRISTAVRTAVLICIFVICVLILTGLVCIKGTTQGRIRIIYRFGDFTEISIRICLKAIQDLLCIFLLFFDLIIT